MGFQTRLFSPKEPPRYGERLKKEEPPRKREKRGKASHHMFAYESLIERGKREPEGNATIQINRKYSRPSYNCAHAQEEVYFVSTHRS